MKPKEFQRWLSFEKGGCAFESHSRAVAAISRCAVAIGPRNYRCTMHSSRRELGTKLIAKIKKDLGL